MNVSIAVVCDNPRRAHSIGAFHRHAPSTEWDWTPSRSAQVNRAWKEGVPAPADGAPIVTDSGQGYLSVRLFCTACRRANVHSNDVQVRLDRLDPVLDEFAGQRHLRATLADIQQALRARHG